jgi:hypothetical protein
MTTSAPCLNVDITTGHHRCPADLVRLLRRSKGVLKDLDVTLSRQDRIGGPSLGGRTKKATQPLPYNVIASEAADVLLAQTISRWAIIIHTATSGWLTASPGDPFAFLENHASVICKRGFHTGLVDEIAASLANAEDALDGAKQWLEAGRCETCNTRMAGKPDAAMVICRGCGMAYDIKERQLRMLADAEEQLVTATDAERLVAMLYAANQHRIKSDRLPKGTISSWYSRGQIVAMGKDATGRPTFRFGDILDKAYGQPAVRIPTPRQPVGQDAQVDVA